MEFESIKQSLVGKKYEKFAKKNFSFLAFLFGGLYYVHRKMYLEGIIFYLINIQLSNLTFYSGDSKFMLAGLLFSLVYGLLFGGLYRNHINKKANYLVAKQTTSDKDCKKHGRTNFLAVILVMIIVSVFQSNVINKFLYEPLFGNPVLNIIKQVVNSADGVDPNVVKLFNQINTVDDLKNLESLIKQFGLDSSVSMESNLQDFTDDETTNEIIDNTIDEDTNTVDEDSENTIDEDLNTTSDEISNQTSNAQTDDETILHSDNWTGTYSLDENTSITIYRSDIDKYEVNLNSLGDSGSLSISSTSVTMEYIDNKTLKYTDFLSEENFVTLSLTTNGIEITETNFSQNDSWGQYLNKEFIKEDFETSNWNGIYKYNDYTIILSELNQNSLYFTLKANYSTFMIGVDEYTRYEINYEDTSFGDTDSLKVSKTVNGLKIESSSTDEDSLLNKINGKEFIKVEEQD